jgi:hypothetical protein
MFKVHGQPELRMLPWIKTIIRPIISSKTTVPSIQSQVLRLQPLSIRSRLHYRE